MSLFSCRDTARRVSELLDHDLPFWLRVALSVHWLMCPACARFHEQMLFLREAARLIEEHAGDVIAEPTGLSAEARARLKRVLEQPD